MKRKMKWSLAERKRGHTTGMRRAREAYDFRTFWMVERESGHTSLASYHCVSENHKPRSTDHELRAKNHEPRTENRATITITEVGCRIRRLNMRCRGTSHS